MSSDPSQEPAPQEPAAAPEPQRPAAAPQLADTDSVDIKIQPFKDPDGNTVYHAYVSYLDAEKKEAWHEIKGRSPIQVLNQLNDTLRSEFIALSRITADPIPDLPPENEEQSSAPAASQTQQPAPEEPAANPS